MVSFLKKTCQKVRQSYERSKKNKTKTKHTIETHANDSFHKANIKPKDRENENHNRNFVENYI